jgi:hypothetical protein
MMQRLPLIDLAHQLEAAGLLEYFFWLPSFKLQIQQENPAQLADYPNMFQGTPSSRSLPLTQ